MTICCRCHEPIGDDERVLVGVPFSASGADPRPGSYACLPCARAYARSPHAPEWVGEQIARTEARISGHDNP